MLSPPHPPPYLQLTDTAQLLLWPHFFPTIKRESSLFCLRISSVVGGWYHVRVGVTPCFAGERELIVFEGSKVRSVEAVHIMARHLPIPSDAAPFVGCLIIIVYHMCIYIYHSLTHTYILCFSLPHSLIHSHLYQGSRTSLSLSITLALFLASLLVVSFWSSFV